MQRIMLSRRTLLGYAAVLLAGGRARADGKGDKPKPSGSWKKKDAEPTLDFNPEGELTIYPHGDNNAIQVGCTYTVTKVGLVKARVKDVDAPEKIIEQIKQAVPIGLEFEFKWMVDGDKATLEEMEGKDIDHIKARLEGEYTKS